MERSHCTRIGRTKTMPCLIAIAMFLHTESIRADTFVVRNNHPMGTESLYQAILDMNSRGVSPSEIEFEISGSKVISLTSGLPSITVSCSINPSNVAGIVLDGSSVSSGPGLRFQQNTVQGSWVRGLQIRNFPAAGIVISTTSNESVVIDNCFIHSNGSHGVMANGGSFHAITNSCVIQGNELDGVCVTNSALSVSVVNSAIQGNGLSGARFLGSNHAAEGCFVVLNGDTEGSGQHNGGVVFGSASNAVGCEVGSCTLAGNEPFGTKIVSGSGNKIRGNEMYLNIEKGIESISAGTLSPPVLSYFVVDEVHDEIVLLVSDSGTANGHRVWEFFVAYDDGQIATDEGAVFAHDESLQLNSSGEATLLVSFDRNVTFVAAAISPNPINFDIDHEDRITATSTDAFGNGNTSEFSVASQPTLPGDFNLDGAVGAADYVIWRNNEGQTNAVYTQGDADFDGDVDDDDYDIWLANFGQTP